MRMVALSRTAMLLILAGPVFAVTDLSTDQVQARIESGERLVLVDVREPGEFDAGHIPGAVNFPWNSGVLGKTADALPRDIPLVVICQSGGRSATASAFLEDAGFDQVLNMLGGMRAWTYGTVTTEEEEPRTAVEYGTGNGSWGTVKAGRRRSGAAR